MKLLYKTIFIIGTIILLLSFASCQSTSSFDIFRAQMEEKVRQIANNMTLIFADRCNSTIGVQCQTKSYDYCQGVKDKTCISDFPKGGDCLSSGAYLSNMSAVRFPTRTNTNSLSQQQKQFVCTSAFLQNTFQDIQKSNKGRYASQYVGTATGSFRIYPSNAAGQQNGACIDYDPRFRPWYVTGTSSSKNIILIIDRSGSMQGTPLDTAKQAAKAVINTWSNHDFVGVIYFNSIAEVVEKNSIQRATSQFKTALIKAIDGLTATGGTNYEQAFKKSFSMLAAATSDQFGAQCNNAQNIFLFLTDGEPTSGVTSSSGIRNIISSLNNRYDVNIFTYAFGNSISGSILTEIACDFKGIRFDITSTSSSASSSSSLLTIMRSYYTYLSQGINITQPSWTEPYDDAFGFGRLVTVAMPIYYTEAGITQILGVAGIDVTIAQISSFGLSQNDAVKAILSSSPCFSSSLSSCQLDVLRGHYNCSSTTGCTNNTILSCLSTPSSIFTTVSSTSNTNICCGLTIGAVVGIVIGVVVGVVIIGIIIACVIKNKANNAALQANANFANQNQNNVTNIQLNQGGYEQPYQPNMYGQQQPPLYGQPYGQQPLYGQPPPYGQPPLYGQPYVNQPMF